MSEEPREWMIGLQGHKDLLSTSEVVRLIRGGQLRPGELVKRGNDPWRAASDVPELASYFAKDKEKESAAEKPPPPAEAPTPHAQSLEDMRRKTSAESKPGSGTRGIRKTKPASGRTSDSSRIRAAMAAVRERRKGSTRVPKAERERPTDRREKSSPKLEDTKISERRSEPRLTPPPKPKPKVERVTLRLLPLPTKYFSVTEVVRYAALAFVPRNLFVAAFFLVPVFLLIGILQIIRPESETVQIILNVVSAIVGVYGLAFTCTVLAFLARRNLEGDDPPLSEVMIFSGANIAAILIYPLLALMPTLLAVALLWVLGFLRDAGENMVVTFRFGHVLFFVLGLVAVSGAVLFQLALAYISCAMAVDALSFREAIRESLGYLHRHGMRVFFHWTIITTCMVAAGAVMMLLIKLAFWLPLWIFGETPAYVFTIFPEIPRPLQVYEWGALALVVLLPASILTTFGTLSYLIIKQEDEVYVAGPPGETASGEMPEESPVTGVSDAAATPPPEDKTEEKPKDGGEPKEEKKDDKPEEKPAEPGPAENAGQ